MIKKSLFILTLLFISFDVICQEDAPTSYSSFFNLSASRYEPAILGQEMTNGQITIINAYAWLANTTFSRQLFSDVFYGNATDEELDKEFDKLKGTNRAGFGATIDYLNMGFKVNRSKKRELFSFSLGMAERIEANAVFSNDFFKLMWNGNKQYAGQTVEFPAFGSAFYTREYTIGLAIPIRTDEDGLSLRVGGRYKLLHGIAGINANKVDGSLYTEPNGKYNILSYDYQMDVAFNDESINPFKPVGIGHAVDIGVSGRYNQRWFANINVLDLGGIKFDKETTRYQKDGAITYEGVVIDNILTDEPETNDTILDEITKDNEFEGDAFKLSYPTRLRVHTSYRIPKEDKNGDEYFIHNLALTYIQGFVDIGNATKRAYLATAYTFNLRNVLEVGTNVGLRGYNNIFEIGFFMAFRAGPMRLGVGSGNITPVIKSFGTGMDANFNMTIAF